MKKEYFCTKCKIKEITFKLHFFKEKKKYIFKQEKIQFFNKKKYNFFIRKKNTKKPIILKKKNYLKRFSSSCLHQL